MTSESKSLTKTLDDLENNIENKENTKVDLEKSDVNSSESELDEDKNEINVRIGDDEDEDEVTINETNNENKSEDVNKIKHGPLDFISAFYYCSIESSNIEILGNKTIPSL